MGHSSEYGADPEKVDDPRETYEIDVDSGVVHADEFTKGDSWTAVIQRIAGKFKIEQRGIERVPEDERTDTNGIVNVGTIVRSSYASDICMLTFFYNSGSQPTWWSARSR